MMEKRQLKNLALILLLPVIFAGMGYFGMKMFLSGAGPDTVLPEANAQVENVVPSDGSENSQSVISNSETTEADDQGNGLVIDTQSDESAVINAAQPQPKVTQPETDSEQGASKETSSAASENLIKYTFEGLSFFSYQVGSYSTNSNATSQVDALAEKNISSYIFAGNNFKVMAGIAPTREDVETLKQVIQTEVPDAFVKGLVIVPDALKYEEGAKGLAEFTKIEKAYHDWLSSRIVFLNKLGTLTESEITAALQNDEQTIDSQLSAIGSFKGGVEFEEAVRNIKENLEKTRVSIGQKYNNPNLKKSVFQMYINELLKYNKIG